jgi:hypothetical protein
MVRNVAVGRPRNRHVQPSQALEVEPDPLKVDVGSVTDLSEICAWLGTYRERLRLAKGEEREQLAAGVQILSNHFRQRRAELA